MSADDAGALADRLRSLETSERDRLGQETAAKLASLKAGHADTASVAGALLYRQLDDGLAILNRVRRALGEPPLQIPSLAKNSPRSPGVEH